MAKVWPVFDGNLPAAGPPWARLSLPEAIAIFELRQEGFVSDLEPDRHFGVIERDLTYAGFKHIVVEVDRNEAQKANWKPGFYKSRVKPHEAFGRLIRQALAAKLGRDNVMRVDWEPTVDSQGQDALEITVVIAPGATQKVKKGAVLDALVNLRERLQEMRDNRVPIVRYATEAELAHDAGP